VPESVSLAEMATRSGATLRPCHGREALRLSLLPWHRIPFNCFVKDGAIIEVLLPHDFLKADGITTESRSALPEPT
jgi:hypothetical protein